MKHCTYCILWFSNVKQMTLNSGLVFRELPGNIYVFVDSDQRTKALTFWRVPSYHRPRKCGTWCVHPSGQHCLSLALARTAGSEFLQWSLKSGIPNGCRQIYENERWHCVQPGSGSEGTDVKRTDKELCVYRPHGQPRLTYYASPAELRTPPPPPAPQHLTMLSLRVCVCLCMWTCQCVYNSKRVGFCPGSFKHQG